MRARQVWAAAVALLLATAMPAHADDCRIGGGPGNVHVVTSDHIRMESETVQAVIYDGFAEYLVDFRFVNSGPAEKVRLGFPFALDDKTQDTPPIALGGFQAWQDGKRLSVVASEGYDGPFTSGWYEHEATFPSGTTMIRVRYVTRPSATAGAPYELKIPPQYAGMVATTEWYPYVLHTGAGWQGTIGRAVVRYSVSEDSRGWGFGSTGLQDGLDTSPLGFKRIGDRTFQWIFEDFEPLQDAEMGSSPFDVSLVSFRSYPWVQGEKPHSDWVKPLATDVSASSRSPLVEWQEPVYGEQNVIDGDPVTAWLSAPGRDGGRDETLRVTLGEKRAVREVRILPGFARLPQDFAERARPKRGTLIFSDGTEQHITFADEPSIQRFAVNATASWMTLRIDEVYPGSMFECVAISEIEVGSYAAPEFEAYDTLVTAQGPVVSSAALKVTNPWKAGMTPVVGDEPAPEEAENTAPAVQPEEPATEQDPGGVALGLTSLLVLLGTAAVFTRRSGSPN